MACSAGLGVILCVGETKDQRDIGQAQSVVSQQLLLLDMMPDHDSEIVIAYEPIWAIGTGLTASPHQAQIMHAFIRERLMSMSFVQAGDTSILYGGSVKSDLAVDLFSEEDVDGFLVGGASLDAGEFCRIVGAAQGMDI